MSNNKDLSKVLESIKINCDRAKYGFATVKGADSNIDIENMVAIIKEAEGLTIIADQKYLKTQKIPFEGPFAKLTIEATTSLELVGLTAALATKLVQENIPANVVAGYFHDHIFVPYNLREDAINKLIELRNI